MSQVAVGGQAHHGLTRILTHGQRSCNNAFRACLFSGMPSPGPLLLPHGEAPTQHSSLLFAVTAL